MSYRDDRDADRARIEALEGELAAANKTIDELKGTRSQALVLASRGSTALAKSQARQTKWLGAPTKLALSRTFDAEFPREKLEQLVDTIRELTGDRGRTELMPSSISWSATAGGPLITIRVRDGRTELEIEQAVVPLPFIASPLVGLFAYFAGFQAVYLSLLPVTAVPFMFAGGGGAIYGLARTLHKRTARKQAVKFQSLFERLVAAIERELPATPVQQAIASESGPRSTDREKSTE